jgi:hypothetical protein
MKTIDELMVISGDLHRLKLSELTEKRIESFRDAIRDFCKRSQATVHPIPVWMTICNILSMKQPGEVWAQFNGDQVICYCVTESRQDLDGKWTVLIAHAWSDTSQSIREHVKQIRIVVEDAFRKGFDRVQFKTRRNEKAWQRLFDNLFVKSGAIFEVEKENFK